LLPVEDAVRLVEQSFLALAAKRAANQPRRRLHLATGSVLHYMAAGDADYFGAKIYSTHPRQGAHFLFLLYRADDARPLAIFEADYLGRIRTGAASALATRWMAREDARILGIIGSGRQARSQVDAIRAVRPLERLRAWSRSQANLRRFAEECGIEPAASAEEAVRDADIVVTATNARDPVIDSRAIAPGAHINAMGSNQATRRELPADLITRAGRIAIDSMEQGRMESGDLLLAGEAAWSNVVELQEIVAGNVAGRVSPDEVTIFKSNGLAIEDVAVAVHVYEQARAAGVSRELPLLE
jgi:ornithine cyclodeaminase/alanine dehydrogenase-like protein (mu-crystallin family)